ncbi:MULTISPECIES: TAXI family TRAP transporter solute-binding subunit [Rhodomicrobium]|uniref:TAXI family TRAP transporter solute-binding subunit n=1 Tax=Rhodomicrobium TaxID=1068 RepID=UPI000B4A5907|nr:MULTISPECIES: TAXI family TRAP transporter solute-binding subunit [Rhodomicrobium]
MNWLNRVLRGAVFALTATTSLSLQQQAFAQQQPAPSAYEDRKREVNENVVTIMASGTASPYTIFAEDMQNVLDQQGTPGGLRVLPILGRGGGANALDTLLLKGVDMGILEQSDLDIAKKKDPAVFANVENRLHYIAKLANSELQLLARNEFNSLRDLEGKKVNCFKKGSSTQIVCEKIFGLLKINIEPVYLDQSEANAKLKTGEIAAAIRFAGAPHNAFTGFKAADGLHFLPLDAETLSPDDFAKLIQLYSPALLKNEHYPELIPADKPVPTIAGAMLLVVYNWPPETERYRRVATFVNELFTNIDKFNGPGRHPKWKEINLAANVPGWKRFRPAQEWLDKWALAEKSATSEMRVAFDRFLKTKGPIENSSPERREALFSQFVQWWNSQKTSQR